MVKLLLGECKVVSEYYTRYGDAFTKQRWCAPVARLHMKADAGMPDASEDLINCGLSSKKKIYYMLN